MSAFAGSCKVASSPDNWSVDGANAGRFVFVSSAQTSKFNQSGSDPNLPSTCVVGSVTGYFAFVAADTDGGASCTIEILDSAGSQIASSTPSIPEGTSPDFNDFREYSVSGGASYSPALLNGIKLQATNGTTGGDPTRRIRWDVQGDNIFSISFTLAAPTGVTTQAASSITGSAATLNGQFNPAGANSSWPTYFLFEWGLTAAYGNSTAVGTGQVGAAPVSVNAAISGLNSNTLYHYRLVAFNNDGSVNGSDLTFTTSATYTIDASELLLLTDTGEEQSPNAISVNELLLLTDSVEMLPSLAPGVVELELLFAEVIDIDAIF